MTGVKECLKRFECRKNLDQNKSNRDSLPKKHVDLAIQIDRQLLVTSKKIAFDVDGQRNDLSELSGRGAIPSLPSERDFASKSLSVFIKLSLKYWSIYTVQFNGR